jgi:hypothetical protein
MLTKVSAISIFLIGAVALIAHAPSSACAGREAPIS